MTIQEPSLETDEEAVLSVDSLNVEYRTPGGNVKAVRDASLTITPGEVYGVAGESGSGKTTLALSILRYLGKSGEITSGDIVFQGKSVLELNPKELRSIRGGELAHVPQDPGKSLNPSITIGDQIQESITLHQDVSKSEAHEQMIGMLESVNIPDPRYYAERYPHELSGGMQQRVLLAMALSCNPKLLILDEPTTGLDVTTQTKILDLIFELKEEFNTSILIISHNLGVLAETADKIGIMYAGEFVEQGKTSDVFYDTRHPYTEALIQSLPEINTDDELVSIPGQIPDLIGFEDGCIFADRCVYSTDECREHPIAMETVHDHEEHVTRCIHWDEVGEHEYERARKTEKAPVSDNVILKAENITKTFSEGSFFGGFFGAKPPVQAVTDVSFEIREAEVLGLVGESGCGKSTLGKTLVRLLNPDSGRIVFDGEDITDANKRKLNGYRSDIQLVFQNPDSSLNPRKTVRSIIERPLQLYTNQSEQERTDRVIELLKQVNLGEGLMDNYPHELSGGQKQRIAIARAFASNPSFIVLDEPTSSLDVSETANILNLLRKLKNEYGTSYLFISHDLGTIKYVSDRIGVMYLGEIVEIGSNSQVLEPPHHPYTRALLSSISTMQREKQDKIRLEGEVPSAKDPPSGCSFHTRCPQYIGSVCEETEPKLEARDGDKESAHCISCHLEDENMM